jgi:hypothetical protein
VLPDVAVALRFHEPRSVEGDNSVWVNGLNVPPHSLRDVALDRCIRCVTVSRRLAGPPREGPGGQPVPIRSPSPAFPHRKNGLTNHLGWPGWVRSLAVESARTELVRSGRAISESPSGRV